MAQGDTYVQGTVTITTTPTLICEPDAGTGGVALYASAAVVVGGANVTATGATAGPTIPATTLVNFPTSAGPTKLYGVVATGTATISYAYAPV